MRFPLITINIFNNNIVTPHPLICATQTVPLDFSDAMCESATKTHTHTHTHTHTQSIHSFHLPQNVPVRKCIILRWQRSSGEEIIRLAHERRHNTGPGSGCPSSRGFDDGSAARYNSSSISVILSGLCSAASERAFVLISLHS